ncbi:hypothetical protein SARC_11816 [Sphaeroforma arctica JP610]|uniref:Uncharacterized protein n=1 Tax=Sphaeroforma arctica JP610 TaxID=667725 RepID=A0A0L0FFZ2_9EUKA|nr:hypothetical protein SARC_11816 [Sphaeroforma arctica JP610]KNC75665.1 hypothetical protein SARC_11816 [Sphaeroforma arctica JP610]|eukprot:XP_014149567.1 hypothetical protein SARC_11816 [Sphaeroforma arctica JP610]
MRAFSVDNCTMARANNKSFDGLLDRITNVVYAKPGSLAHESITGLSAGVGKVSGAKNKCTKNTHPAFSQRSKSASLLNISANFTSDFSEVEVRKMKSSEGLNESPQGCTHKRTVAVLVEHCQDSDAYQSDSSVNDFSERAGPNMKYNEKNATCDQNDSMVDRAPLYRPMSLTLTPLKVKSAFIVSRASQTSISSSIEAQLVERTRKTHNAITLVERSSLLQEPTAGIVPRTTPTLAWKDDVVMNDRVVDFAVMDPEEKAALKKRMKAKFVRKHNSPRVRQANKSFLLHYAKVKV